jgi:NADH dehydrogenase/NADH:ubiquinone oxidoreductase subunit G
VDAKKDPKNSASENTKKTCEMAKKLKSKFISMKKKAQKIRDLLKNGRSEHRKNVELQKSQEAKCVVTILPQVNSESPSSKLGIEKKANGLFKNGKRVKKFAAIVALGVKDPSNLK